MEIGLEPTWKLEMFRFWWKSKFWFFIPYPIFLYLTGGLTAYFVGSVVFYLDKRHEMIMLCYRSLFLHIFSLMLGKLTKLCEMTVFLNRCSGFFSNCIIAFHTLHIPVLVYCLSLDISHSFSLKQHNSEG